MKRFILSLVVFLIFTSHAIKADSLGVMPSVVANFSNTHRSAFGASLKYASTGESPLPYFYNSGELLYYYSPDSRLHSVEVTTVSFADFLSPGFALQHENNRYKTLLLVELDLFYFPFAIMSIIIFKNRLL